MPADFGTGFSFPQNDIGRKGVDTPHQVASDTISIYGYLQLFELGNAVRSEPA